MTARSVQIASRAEIMSRDEFILYLDEAIKEVRAEALQEAADRAVEWSMTATMVIPEQLRAAILNEEAEK